MNKTLGKGILTSKLAAHVCEEGHQIDRDQPGFLQFGPITVYRKYEVAAECR